VQVPAGYRVVEDDTGTGVVRTDLASLPLDAWWARGDPLAGAKGRGAVARLEVGGVRAVVRGYRRGGAFRRILSDRFLDRRRATRELVVTAELRWRGAPVVEPLAAVARRRGLLFELRLATCLVEGAMPLPEFVVVMPPLRRAAVESAGRAVLDVFDRGLRHPDLHPDNLLARAVGESGCEIVLIDFDRASLVSGPVPGPERDRMLVRMARYLWRHGVAAARTDFVRFLRGFGLGRAERRAAVARLRPRLARALARRGLARTAAGGRRGIVP
jgi:3-deoxy-D-manno-octulosonic acid kinase